jgi:hypothetical protein
VKEEELALIKEVLLTLDYIYCQRLKEKSHAELNRKLTTEEHLAEVNRRH